MSKQQFKPDKNWTRMFNVFTDRLEFFPTSTRSLKQKKDWIRHTKRHLAVFEEFKTIHDTSLNQQGRTAENYMFRHRHDSIKNECKKKCRRQLRSYLRWNG